MILFHMTSEESCRAIVASRKMLPGNGGMFGAGIYFCDNEADCQGKARSKGVTLRCLVKVGRSLICESADSTLCMAKVRRLGCTSVKAPGGYAVRKDEYAVFEPWQVERIEVQSYHEDGAVRPRAAWPAWVIAVSEVAAAYRPQPAPTWAEPAGGFDPGAAAGVPIAKSTGLPDRRFSAGGRHSRTAPGSTPDSRPRDLATGIPIAASTGRPDRRYTQPGRPAQSASAFLGSGARVWNGNPAGPLTRAGLPDMRFSANFSASPPARSLSAPMGGLEGFAGFAGSGAHRWNGNDSGPVTKAGLPDMRFKCNRE